MNGVKDNFDFHFANGDLDILHDMVKATAKRLTKRLICGHNGENLAEADIRLRAIFNMWRRVLDAADSETSKC